VQATVAVRVIGVPVGVELGPVKVTVVGSGSTCRSALVVDGAFAASPVYVAVTE
jgi:hypothetical protein